MLTFAWVVLVLSSITLIWFIADILFGIPKNQAFRDKRINKLVGLLPITLWILGCLWFILDLTVLPDLLVMGIALLSAVVCSICEIKRRLKRFSLEIIDTTSFAVIAFFAFAIVQSIWPSLIAF